MFHFRHIHFVIVIFQSQNDNEISFILLFFLVLYVYSAFSYYMFYVIL